VLLPFLYPPLLRTNGAAAFSSRHRLSVASSNHNNGREKNIGRRYNSTVVDPDNEHVLNGKPPSRLNPTPDDYSAPYFADKAKLTICAGPGGSGCISFLRELFIAEGPANGGDGGHGGSVYIQAVRGETSLHKLAKRRVIRAGRGRNGQGSSKSGTRGEDVVITVPVGTVVTEISRIDPEAEQAMVRRSRRDKYRKAAPRELDADGEPVDNKDEDIDKWVLYPGISKSEAKRLELPRLPRRDRIFTQPEAPLHLDLSRPTPQPILLAAGALGGLGNPHFVNKDRPRPMFATKGEKAMSMEIELELKLLADVGLVGLPNAGKSTLLRALTNSRARVGSWAFTTLQPNIGTVVLDSNKGRPLLKSYRKLTDPDDPFVPTTEEDMEQRTRFTIADIPGLIEGAHLDKGLGISFLRHVERAGVLAFVIDLSAGNAVAALKALWNEVGLYAQMRDEEERDRIRAARVDWRPEAGIEEEEPSDDFLNFGQKVAEAHEPEPEHPSLYIAEKPWFVVATKGDLPNTQENFKELREYLTRVTNGEAPHPSNVEGAWTENCMAIPVSAINGHGVESIIHWTVGLLDG